MPSLCSLPNECLLLIYGQLADFDDAINLSRASPGARHLFQYGRRSIFKSIILHSVTYKYDLRLCRLVEANRTSSWTGQALARCLSAKPQDLTDEHIWSIVRRWEQARTLYDLYTDPAVQAEYCGQKPQCVHHFCPHHRSSFTGLPPSVLVEGTDDVDGAAWHRPSSHHLNLGDLESQRKRRFYTALTAYWTAVEAQQLASAAAAASSSCSVTPARSASTFELVDRLWIGREDRTLLEAMDVLEVHDFVYDFLLGRLLPELVQHRRRMEVKVFRLGPAWEAVLQFGRLRLRPSALAQLIRHGPDAVAVEAEAFFAELSSVSASDATTRLLAERRSPVRLMERAVEDGLRQHGIMRRGHDLALVWSCYRNHWAQQARGVLFSKALTPADVIRDIERYADQAACLARHPHFVPLAERAQLSSPRRRY